MADVVNGTGEPVFDLALKSALETDLRQSPFVNVLDPAQVRNTLQLCGSSPKRGSTRGSAGAVPEGRRSSPRRAAHLRAGEAYQVDASLVEPATGRVAAEAHVLARGRERCCCLRSTS